jgi:hypothetical protein
LPLQNAIVAGNGFDRSMQHIDIATFQNGIELALLAPVGWGANEWQTFLILLKISGDEENPVDPRTGAFFSTASR